MFDNKNETNTETVEVEMTITRYNHGTLLGWLALACGIVYAAILFPHPTADGLACLASGLILGGIAITFGGPLRTVHKQRIRVKQLPTERGQAD